MKFSDPLLSNSLSNSLFTNSFWAYSSFSVLTAVTLLISPLLNPSHALASSPVSAAATSTMESSTEDSETDRSVDAVVEQIMDSRQIPGLSLAVVQDGKLLKTQGYGLLDRELNIHTRPSSVFPIASMSKPFTAQGIMLLVQESKVDLDAPISTYLPDTPEHWADITVRHLLNHTAGLSEQVYEADIMALASARSFLPQASKAPLDFQPGESWMYSNTGYALAAIIIENVSGLSFDAFMEARLFDPLGMGHTDTLRESYVFSNRASGYVAAQRGHTVEPIDVPYSLLPRLMPSLRGAGSITSTVLDIARWEIALQKGQLLDAQTQLEMQQPVVMNSGRIFRYGLGWFLDRINGHRVVSHGGNIFGYSTSISRFPDDGLTVIMLTNKNNEPGDELARKIAEQYVPELVIDREAAAITDPNPVLTGQLLDYLNGDEDAIAQTSELQILLSTPRGQGISRGFAQAIRRGSVDDLELLAQEAHPNGMRYRYRAVMPQGNRLVSAVVTHDGLLAAIGAAPEL